MAPNPFNAKEGVFAAGKAAREMSDGVVSSAGTLLYDVAVAGGVGPGEGLRERDRLGRDGRVIRLTILAHKLW